MSEQIASTTKLPKPQSQADPEPGLLRGWAHNDDDLISVGPIMGDDVSVATTATAAATEKQAKEEQVPKFQPGDHVIRWKILKVALWPIQIHGIVLESEVTENGEHKVVIADFGYSSTQQKKKGPFKNLQIKGINDMMKNFYDKKDADDAAHSHVGPPPPSKEQVDEDDQEDDEALEEDGKRFHLRTITDPKLLKKWSKVNYGQSLFSSKGKLEKIKKLFKISNKKKNGPDDESTVDDDSSLFDDHDEFFKTSAHSQILGTVSEERDSKPTGSKTATSTNGAHQQTTSFDDMEDLEKMIQEANEVERRTRPRSRGIPGFLKGRNVNKVSDDSSVSSFGSVRSTNSQRSIRPIAGMNNLLKKMSLQKKKPEPDAEDLGYGTIPATTSDENEEAKEEPKLPKSDPRAIVLERVRFILAEQDKPEDETALPKYHILYSNSECLAVWCKTGKFNTLQAAVFLHSTSVCNAKSSFLLGAGVAATQPWLIPVVGVYAVAAVGMPYIMLRKCHQKWKISENRLTFAFWQSCSNECIVSAVQNWSGLTPELVEDSDEVGDDLKKSDSLKDASTPVVKEKVEAAPIIEQV